MSILDSAFESSSSPSTSSSSFSVSVMASTQASMTPSSYLTRTFRALTSATNSSMSSLCCYGVSENPFLAFSASKTLLTSSSASGDWLEKIFFCFGGFGFANCGVPFPGISSCGCYYGITLGISGFILLIESYELPFSFISAITS